MFESKHPVCHGGWGAAWAIGQAGILTEGPMRCSSWIT